MEKDGILEYYREKLEDILSNPKLNEFDGIRRRRLNVLRLDWR